jgi:hypothetical protein
MEESQIQQIINQVRGYKEEVVKITKALSTKDVAEIVEMSITEKQSTQALGKITNLLNQVEEVLFNVSIVKMELRSLINSFPKTQNPTILQREVQLSLNVVGDCYVIAKTRYDHIAQVVGTVKSINSNLRLSIGKNVN